MIRFQTAFAILLVLLVGIVPDSMTHRDQRVHRSAFYKRSSGALALSADGGTLLVVNPDSDLVSLVDCRREEVVAEIAVQEDPRTVAVDDSGMRAYVANRGSGTISVIDIPARRVVASPSVAHQPYGVVLSPGGARLYIAEQGDDRISVLDTATLTIDARIPVADRPSGLAVDDAGRTLFVSHLFSNTISVISLERNTSFLPLLAQGADSASQGTPRRQHQAAAQLFASTIALWPDSNLVQSIVLSPAGDRAYVPHTRSNTGNRVLTFDTTVFPLVSTIDLNTRQHLVGQQIDLATLDPPGVGLPWDAAVTPNGSELWVLNAASNDITVIDLAGRRRRAHIEVGHNPRGIVLSPDGARAYVNNSLAGTVSVLDTANYTVTATITVTQIPLPPLLLRGKQLFHTSDDPRLSARQWIACNTCHFEGEHDGRTWFFGFAGPRNTTSLLGMVETYPLRWSGEWDESADSEFAIRKENFGSGLVDGPLHCALAPVDCVAHPPNQGRDYDLDALAAFLDSLPMPLSPDGAAGRPLSESEQRGEALFSDPATGCVACHPPPLYTDRRRHDVGTATAGERLGPAYDTPSLRGLYASAPYFHDGSAATLDRTLTRPGGHGERDLRGLLTPEQIEDLIAYLLVLPYR